MDANLTQQSHGVSGQGMNPPWVIPCLLLVLALASLSIDVPMASRFADDLRPPWLDQSPGRQIVEASEWFGEGRCATVIVLAVGAINFRKAWRLPWLFAGSLGAGLAADLVKCVIGRTRPRDFDLMRGTVWETFLGSTQSFPSAHTATAFGLAVMLSTVYPRGRELFFLLAILVGLQRIVTSAHFPSDVFAGAAVGWVVGTLCATAMKSQMDTPTAKTQSRPE